MADEHNVVSTGLGPIRISMCTHKSYIRRLEESTWVHVVTVTQTQCSDHQQLMNKLFQYAQRHPVDKDGLNLQKDFWLAEVNGGAEVTDLGSDVEE